MLSHDILSFEVLPYLGNIQDIVNFMLIFIRSSRVRFLMDKVSWETCKMVMDKENGTITYIFENGRERTFPWNGQLRYWHIPPCSVEIVGIDVHNLWRHFFSSNLSVLMDISCECTFSKNLSFIGSKNRDTIQWHTRKSRICYVCNLDHPMCSSKNGVPDLVYYFGVPMNDVNAKYIIMDKLPKYSFTATVMTKKVILKEKILFSSNVSVKVVVHMSYEKKNVVVLRHV